MRHQCSLSRMCTDSLRALEYVTLHSSVKSTVSVLFASVCTKDLELIWAARWSNWDQSETLSASKKSFHEMLLKPPECALLCLEQCSVALSRSCSTLFPYEYTSGKENTRQIARFRCHLILCVHWTWNQDGMVSDRTVPKLMHFGKKKTKFSWHKSLNCPECAQLSLVHCSVHETYAKLFLMDYSVAFYSPWGDSLLKS